MLNESSPEAANRVVAFTGTISGEAGTVAVTEPRIMVRRGASRAALYLAHVGSLSQEIPPSPEQPEKSIWSSVFGFFVEGFAHAGAPLYPPVAYLGAGGVLLEADVPQREASAANERRTVLSLVPNAAPTTVDDSHATSAPAMGTVTSPSREIEKPTRWSWLTSCWEVAVAIWAHMRREREIRQAIDALAALDDFTLKDIGIHHRGQIEHVVRNSDDR